MSNLITKDRLQELLPQLFSQQQREGDYYLRFQLTTEITALIDLKHVRESLTISGDSFTAVPNLPEYVVGLMSSRNQVFLALDLAHLVGFPPETVNLRQYQTIIIENISQNKTADQPEHNLIGLTVRRILGISRILPSHFHSVAGQVPEVLSPFCSSFVSSIQGQNSAVTEQAAISGARSQLSFLIDLPQLIQSQI